MPQLIGLAALAGAVAVFLLIRRVLLRRGALFTITRSDTAVHITGTVGRHSHAAVREFVRSLALTPGAVISGHGDRLAPSLRYSRTITASQRQRIRNWLFTKM